MPSVSIVVPIKIIGKKNFMQSYFPLRMLRCVVQKESELPSLPMQFVEIFPEIEEPEIGG